MSEQTPQRSAQEALVAILREEQRQTRLLKPISALATIAIVILIAAIVLGVVGFVFSMIVNAAAR
jgi:cell division septal protein FtsQ